MTVRIYQPAKSAMQSAPCPEGGSSREWVLEFENNSQFIEPLMGWTGSTTMLPELTLYFKTCEDAIVYAEKNQLPYEIWQPQEKRIIPKSYASNFK